MQGRIAETPHDRAQKHGFEIATVIGQMAVGLAESRDDLRHLQTELSVCVRQCRTVAVGVAFMPFGGVRPDLNTLLGKGRAKDRRKYDDDDDRSEYMRNRYDDDDDRAYSDRSERAFKRMDTNSDGMIDKQEFKSHMQTRNRS